MDFWVDVFKDKEFQDIFLATYPVFTNSLEVFHGLRSRFEAAASGDDPPHSRAFRRYRYAPRDINREAATDQHSKHCYCAKILDREPVCAGRHGRACANESVCGLGHQLCFYG